MTALRTDATGFTLIEILVSLAISGIIFAAAMVFFFDASWRARDTAITLTTWEEGTVILSFLASEARLTGSGMPLSQSGFAAGTAGLGDAPLPLLTTSTASRITFRSARSGTLATLTADYTPSAAQLTFSVDSTSRFAVGDTIYVSNLPRGGSAALSGTITALSATQITIRDTYVASAAATFAAGSVAQAVETITYETQGTDPSIVRSDGRSSLTVAAHASFTVEYLDRNSAVMTLPLTTAAIDTQLAGLRVSLRVMPRQRMRIRQNYVAQITQTIALRNLLMQG